MENEQQTMTSTDFDTLLGGINDGSVDTIPADPVVTVPGAEGQAASTEGGTTVAGTENTTATDTEAQTDATETEQKKNTGNAAFAAMRIQNKKIQDALSAVLAASGKDPALALDPDKLLSEAQQVALQAEADRQKVPKELLTRLTQLEKQEQARVQGQLAQQAIAGFNKLKADRKLSNDDIAAFARQLQEAGTDPFEQEMDLEQHYKLHNMDKILQEEIQKAVQAALSRQDTANTHSTTPSKVNGKADTGGAPAIDTPAQFDRFLLSLEKK